MMISFRPLAAFVLAASLAVTPAQAFVASNGLLVQRVNETDFFVPFRGRSEERRVGKEC